MAKTKVYRSGICVVWTDSSDCLAFCELIKQQSERMPYVAAFIYYSAHQIPPKELNDTLSQLCPSLVVCGCSTGGEISPDGLQDNGAIAILLPPTNFSVLIDSIEDVHSIGMNNIADKAADQRTRFEHLYGKASMENTFAVLFIDGLTYSEESVTAALHRGLNDIPLIGASAGDDLTFRKTTQLCKGRVLSNSAVLALVQTRLPFHLFTENNFSPTGGKLVVTEADPDSRTVFEFNAEPAAYAYADAIGVERSELGPNCFASNPLVVRVGGEYHCRSLQRVNRDDSLTFFSAIDTGVVLTVAKTEGMVRSMNRSLKRIESVIGPIDVTLGFECVYRKLDARHRNVIERIENLYMENNIVAFNSYGEQYQSMHVNQTFTGVAFGTASGPA